MSAVILSSDGFEYNGIKGMALQSTTETKHPQYGYGWEQVFLGLPDVVGAFFRNLASDQAARRTSEGPLHRLVVFTPDNPSESESGILTSTFELLGNSLQKDIREHPLAIQLGPATLAKIDRIINNVRLPNPDYDPAVSGSQPYSPLEEIDEGGFEETLYNSLVQRRGNMGFNTSQFVFRGTIIASRRAQITVPFAGMNTVYSTAGMLAETNPPADYVFSAQVAYDATDPGAQTGYTYGWLKQSPTVSSAPGNRVAVQTEYWLGEWEDWVYA